MRRQQELDDLGCLRSLYAYLRSQRGRPAYQGWAGLLWRRLHGPNPTTFVVNTAGECWPFDRAALIAEYRLLLLEQDLPVAFVATFDRTDN